LRGVSWDLPRDRAPWTGEGGGRSAFRVILRGPVSNSGPGGSSPNSARAVTLGFGTSIVQTSPGSRPFDAQSDQDRRGGGRRAPPQRPRRDRARLDRPGRDPAATARLLAGGRSERPAALASAA